MAGNWDNCASSNVSLGESGEDRRAASEGGYQTHLYRTSKQREAMMMTSRPNILRVWGSKLHKRRLTTDHPNRVTIHDKVTTNVCTERGQKAGQVIRYPKAHPP